MARKSSLEISFLSYQEFYLYLRRIYNRKNNRSYSWDGTSSHSRKAALAISAAVDFSFFRFLRMQEGGGDPTPRINVRSKDDWEFKGLIGIKQYPSVVESTLGKQI